MVGKAEWKSPRSPLSTNQMAIPISKETKEISTTTKKLKDLRVVIPTALPFNSPT